MSLLVYHTGALGDFLCMLHAIRAWRFAHPGESVILFGKPAFGMIAVQCGYVDEVWDAQSASNAWLFFDKAPLPKTVRDQYSSITTAIIFTSPGSFVETRLRAAGVKDIISHMPFPSQRISAVLYYRTCFFDLEPWSDFSNPLLHSFPSLYQGALPALDGGDRFMAIHPGSGSTIKNWPIEKFFDLAMDIERRGFRIVWVVGEAEDKLPVLPGSRVIRNAPLSTLVHLFRRCAAFIGNDSGISHLAASTGCKCIVLFGPSDDVVWSPTGPHVTIVKARRSCGPCHPIKSGADKCRNSCMRLISVRDVLEAFVRITSPGLRPPPRGGGNVAR